VKPPPYTEGNPSTAFAARLIPQYESHIRVTKGTLQFVVNLTKEIPHRNRVTKERTPKLSQHVSHQGTVREGGGWTIVDRGKHGNCGPTMTTRAVVQVITSIQGVGQ